MSINLRFRVPLVALIACGLAVGLTNTVQARLGARSQDPSGTAQRAPTISPRDKLQIQVFGEDRFSQTYLVGIDGTFEFPQLGRMKAAGLTTKDLEVELTKKLADGYLIRPQVTVALEQLSGHSVSVSGEVNSTGTFPYPGRITLLHAIIMAGGVKDTAGDEALVLRNGDNIVVDLQAVVAGDQSKDIALQDGDTVIVRKALPVYVNGFVTAPGEYIVRRGATVEQVVTQAGGIGEKGSMKGIVIQRPNADKSKKPVEIKVANPKTEIVKPGDTIRVPKRIF